MINHKKTYSWAKSQVFLPCTRHWLEVSVSNYTEGTLQLNYQENLVAQLALIRWRETSWKLNKSWIQEYSSSTDLRFKDKNRCFDTKNLQIPICKHFYKFLWFTYKSSENSRLLRPVYILRIIWPHFPKNQQILKGIQIKHTDLDRETGKFRQSRVFDLVFEIKIRGFWKILELLNFLEFCIKNLKTLQFGKF